MVVIVIRFQPRLQLRLIFAFVFVLLIPTALIGTYTINTLSNTLIEAARASSLQSTVRDTDLIGTFLGRSSSDILTVSQSANLHHYVSTLSVNNAAGLTDDLAPLQNLFMSYIQNQEVYESIALLDTSGHEVVRLNHVNGIIAFARPDELQSRAHDTYFTLALGLAPGQVSISRLSLSTIGSAAEKNLRPVLHFSVAALDDSGKVAGVLVMDLLGQSFLSLLKPHSLNEQVYLIDIDGTYLAGPDQSRLYGRDLHTGYSFFKDSPDEAGKIFGQIQGTYFGSVDHPDWMQSFARVVPNMGSQNSSQSLIRWTVYRVQPISTVLADVYNSRIVVLALSTLALLIALIIASLLTFQIVRPLRLLAKAARQLGAGHWDMQLPPVRGHDEIGELTRSFNEMTAAIKVAYDDLKQRTLELETANALAKENSRLKSEFMATMSHELRTPLNAIIGFSGVMMSGMGGELDSEATHMVQRIDANSTRLLGLINDILDIAKIEAGRLEIVNEPVSLAEMMKAWRAQMGVLAEKKGLAFDLNISPDIPADIYMDRERLTQLVVNLLSNAFKFTEVGSVTLSINRDKDKLLVDVSDTGIGIPPHAMNYIFDEFRQVDGSTRRAFGGTGLGLAIVRNLCRMMDGSIHVSSIMGKGSTFTVTLPLRPVEKQGTPSLVIASENVGLS